MMVREPWVLVPALVLTPSLFFWWGGVGWASGRVSVLLLPPEQGFLKPAFLAAQVL